MHAHLAMRSDSRLQSAIGYVLDGQATLGCDRGGGPDATREP